MKKSIWILILTVITVFCVIGGTVYHLGGGRYRIGMGLTSQSVSDMETFTSINVDADMMDLTITKGDSLFLQYQYTGGIELSYEVKNGTLFIIERQRKQGFGIWGHRASNDKCSLSLTIPSGTVLDSMDIQTAIGDIRIEGITSSQCDIRNDLGNCNLKECSFSKSDFDASLGDISVYDTSLGDAEFDNGLGNVEVSGCTFGNLDINVEMGQASVDTEQDLEGYHMEIEADLGNIQVNGHQERSTYHQGGNGAGKIVIEAGMGSVRLDYGKK